MPRLAPVTNATLPFIFINPFLCSGTLLHHGNCLSKVTKRDEWQKFCTGKLPRGQERIAEQFGVKRPAITKHLKNIFESGELLEKEVSSILEHTTRHGAISGKTQIAKSKLYNLDAIISIGYRVNSATATAISAAARKRSTARCSTSTLPVQITILTVPIQSGSSWWCKTNCTMPPTSKPPVR